MKITERIKEEITRSIITGVKCDCCGKDIPEESIYYTGYLARDVGINDPIEELESEYIENKKDYCSKNCLSVALMEYVNTTNEDDDRIADFYFEACELLLNHM